MARRAHLLACAACLTVAACNYRSPGAASGAGADGSAADSASENRTVETLIGSPAVDAGQLGKSLQITAGAAVVVRCIVKKDEAYLSDVETELDSAPALVDTVTQTDKEAFNFVATRAGTYQLSCRIAGASVIDPKGVSLVVAAGEAVSTDTILPLDVAQAGVAAEVQCPVYDVYGNEVPMGVASGVDAPVQITIEASSGLSFFARGTTLGDFPLACRIGGYADPTPEVLTILAGIPGATNTTVSSNDVSPTDSVAVSCAVTDAYGNPLDGVATSYTVLAADGSYASQDGLQLSSGSFSATRAGDYYVFCNVPGYYAGDETPAVVTVHPGLPYSWVVDLLAQDCYWQDRALPLDVLVYDFWGNAIVDSPYEVSANGTAILPDANGDYYIAGEGDFTVEVSIVGPTYNAVVIPPETIDIRIDSTPPQVNITSPSRAAALLSGVFADSAVPITGNVDDGVSTITSFVLNGVPWPTNGTGSLAFSTTQSARWGQNVITGSVTDSCGNRGTVAQSYLRSPSYFTAALSPNSGARAPSGVVAHLNQPVIDDGYDYYWNGWHRLSDDLAGLAYNILSKTDINGAVPYYITASPDANNDKQIDSVTYSCGFWPVEWTETNQKTGYWVRRQGASNSPTPITYDTPEINFVRAVPNGLHMSMTVGKNDGVTSINLPLQVHGHLDTGCLGETGITVKGNVKVDQVTVDATLSVYQSGGAPQVYICPTCVNVTLDGLWIDIDWGPLNFISWLLNDITNFIVGFFDGAIADLLESQLRSLIPPLVKDFLNSFGLATSFDVPAPLSTRISLSSGIDYLSFSGPEGSGYGKLGLYAQLYPSWRGSSIPWTSRGAIRKDGAMPSFATGASANEFGIGLKDDLVNQLLWSIWYSGALDLSLAELQPLTGSLDLSGVSMTLSAKSPPVLMPGRGGPQIQIGLGDAYVDANVDLMQLLGQPSSSGAGVIHVGMYLSTIMGGSIDLDPTNNELLVALDPDPQMWVQVVDIDDPGYQGIMSDLFTELLKLVLPPLLENIVGSFPIPAFDLSGVGGLPAGTVWELYNGQIDHAGSYYRLSGSLQ